MLLWMAWQEAAEGRGGGGESVGESRAGRQKLTERAQQTEALYFSAGSTRGREPGYVPNQSWGRQWAVEMMKHIC